MNPILLIPFILVDIGITTALTILIATDAKKRGMNVIAWAVLTFVTGIFIFGWIGMTLIYFLIRQPVEIEPEKRDEERSSTSERRQPSHQPQDPKSGGIGDPIDDVVFQRSEAPTAETAKSTLPVDAVSNPTPHLSTGLKSGESDADVQFSPIQQDSEPKAQIYEKEDAPTLDSSVSEGNESTPERSLEAPDSISLGGARNKAEKEGGFAEPAYDSPLGEPDDTEIDLDDNTTAMLEVPDEPAVFARLFVTTGPDKGREFVLPTDEEERVLIGRKPPSDIILTDKTVSGEHASIRVDGGEHCLSDQASKHGTFVYKGGKIEEDEKVRGEQTLSLQDNDVIEMGKTQLIFVKVGG